jgi:hypothetical protein
MLCVAAVAIAASGCTESPVSGGDQTHDPIEQEITQNGNLPEDAVTSGGDIEIPQPDGDLADSSSARDC